MNLLTSFTFVVPALCAVFSPRTAALSLTETPISSKTCQQENCEGVNILPEPHGADEAIEVDDEASFLQVHASPTSGDSRMAAEAPAVHKDAKHSGQPHEVHSKENAIPQGDGNIPTSVARPAMGK